jgi:hypothetical protein
VTWARLDDSSLDHEKFLSLSESLSPMEALAADGLWRRGLVYACKHLTDGFLPRSAIPKLAGLSPAKAFKLAAALVAARGRSEYGLWLAVDSGYQIHDFDQWNPNREETEKKRAARVTAGRIGGLRSGEARRKQDGSKSEATVKHPASPERSKTEALALPVPNPVPIPKTPLSPPEANASSGDHPTTLPPEAFNTDCPDRYRWADPPRCLNRAWLAAHPEVTRYPALDSKGTPRQCPHHRRLQNETAQDDEVKPEW